jgi:hypothetical protein
MRYPRWRALFDLDWPWTPGPGVPGPVADVILKIEEASIEYLEEDGPIRRRTEPSRIAE